MCPPPSAAWSITPLNWQKARLWFYMGAAVFDGLSMPVLTLITGIPGTAMTALILNIILPRSPADKEYERRQAEENARLEAEAEAKVAAQKG